MNHNMLKIERQEGGQNANKTLIKRVNQFPFKVDRKGLIS
jgi:hypothetical protein